MRAIAILATLVIAAGLLPSGQALGAGDDTGAKAHLQGGSQSETPGGGSPGGVVSGPAHSANGMAIVPLDGDKIRYLQHLLQEKGYDVGSEDGMIGPQTADAIRQFQEAQGLAATGTPDRQTIRTLAPDPEDQVYFGLSPAFGPKGPSEK